MYTSILLSQSGGIPLVLVASPKYSAYLCGTCLSLIVVPFTRFKAGKALIHLPIKVGS